MSSAADDETLRHELAQLEVQIRHHEDAYRAGTPEITDAVFDDMVARYSELADALGISEGERPDTKPGDDHTEGFAQVAHVVPMLSLEKLTPNRRDTKGQAVPIAEQLGQWLERRRKDLELDATTPLPFRRHFGPHPPMTSRSRRVRLS